MEWIVGIGIGLFLLFRFPKPTLALTAFLAIIVAGVVGYSSIESYQEERRRAKIQVHAQIDPTTCSDQQYPVTVTFTNGSSETVSLIAFRLNAYRSGFSKPVLSYPYAIESDRILPPGDGWRTCYSAPSGETNSLPLSDLLWEAPISRISWAAPGSR